MPLWVALVPQPTSYKEGRCFLTDGRKVKGPAGPFTRMLYINLLQLKRHHLPWYLTFLRLPKDMFTV